LPQTKSLMPLALGAAPFSIKALNITVSNPRFVRLFRVSLTLDEWTPDSGLVTAAFKIRRREVVDRYKSEIEEMYQKI
jgi:long-subunit acyl-CoA synthetase (AMP-forming)